jgi:hypothetical protein
MGHPLRRVRLTTVYGQFTSVHFTWVYLHRLRALDGEAARRLVGWSGSEQGLSRSYGRFGGLFRGLSWVFTALAGWCSGYFKVSGIVVSMSSKACRWVLVGSASIGTVAVVPAKRTWLRVRVARCSSRPRKLW